MCGIITVVLINYETVKSYSSIGMVFGLKVGLKVRFLKSAIKAVSLSFVKFTMPRLDWYTKKQVRLCC